MVSAIGEKVGFFTAPVDLDSPCLKDPISMSILDHLKDFRIVKVSLPIKDGLTLTLEGVVRRKSVNTIEAAFLPGQLPVKDLDLSAPCRIFFEEEGKAFRLKSSIEEIIDGEKIRLKAVETMLHYGDREYFRVDADLTFEYSRLVEANDVQPRQLSARVNISGCGIRLPLQDSVRDNEKIALTLILGDDPTKVVHCIGEVKRLCPFAGGQTGAALVFIEIEPAGRDAIIAFCLAAQREELRNKIQIKD